MRRWVVLLGICFSASSLAQAEEWPRWRGVRGDGTWRGPEIAESVPESGLTKVWEHDIGGGYAGVTVANGLAYLCDRVKEPQELERIRCYDAQSGELKWSYDYPVQYGMLDYGNGPRAAPTIHDGRLYSLGAVGHLCCLDAATGEKIWAMELIADRGGRMSTWGYSASPFIVDDNVIVLTGADQNKSVVAFDQQSGEVCWSSLSDEAGYATPMVIEHNGARQLICWTPSHIRSLDPTDGRLFWSVPYEVQYGVSIATPIFQEGIVFVAGYWDGSKAIQLGQTPRDASLLWEDKRLLRGLMSQPLYRDGYVYLLDKQYGVTCFELKSGKKRWDDGNQLTPRGRNPQASLVWLNDSDRILALNADGQLVLAQLSPEGYKEFWRTPIIGETWAHPAYAGTRVFARSDTKLVCYELPIAESSNEQE